MKPTACYEMVVTNKEAARDMLRSIIRWCGLGFHPDTPAKDYIDPVTKQPSLLKFEAEMFDANMHNAFELLDDVYQESMEIWHELGMITTEEYYTMSGLPYITDKTELIAAIDEVLLDLVAEHGEAYHVMYEHPGNEPTCIEVNLLDRDGTHTVIELIVQLSEAVYKKTGRYLSYTTNSPTDGSVLVFLDETSDNKYDPECFKKAFIAQFEAWRAGRTRYDGPHAKAIIYQTLDDVIERECFGNRWQDVLKPNFEMWHQVMCMARNGVSNPDAPCIFTHFLEDNDNG